jgi:hypothetical protein
MGQVTGPEKTKQSSMSGSETPRVKGVSAEMAVYGAGPEVGMPPASTGRKRFVLRATEVSAMVGSPERLK